MPKARGDEVEEALLDLEDKWDNYDDEGLWEEYSADWYIDASGIVKIDKREYKDPALLEEFDDVDPAIWPMAMQLVRLLSDPRDRADDDLPLLV